METRTKIRGVGRDVAPRSGGFLAEFIAEFILVSHWIMMILERGEQDAGENPGIRCSSSHSRPYPALDHDDFEFEDLTRIARASVGHQRQFDCTSNLALACPTT